MAGTLAARAARAAVDAAIFCASARLRGADVVAAHLLGAQAIALAPQAMLVAAQAGIDGSFGSGIRRIHGRGRGPGAATRGP